MRTLRFLVALLFVASVCYAATDTFEGSAVTTSTDIEGTTGYDTAEGSSVVAGGGEPPSFTGLFYSDFEDEPDDSQWTTTPTGWNDDYTATALEGSESVNMVVGGSAEVRTGLASISASADTTIYMRAQVRVLDYGAGGSYAIGVLLSQSGTTIADCHLTTDTDTANVIYAEDSTGVSTGTNPADVDISSGTYYLYLTYNDDTSVTCELRDSDFVLVSGWQDTNNTNNGEVPNEVGLYLYRQNQSVVFDSVEVREDTDWGN